MVSASGVSHLLHLRAESLQGSLVLVCLLLHFLLMESFRLLLGSRHLLLVHVLSNVANDVGNPGLAALCHCFGLLEQS